LRNALAVIVFTFLFLSRSASPTSPPPAPACYLVTSGELESLLGAKITSGLTTHDSDTTHFCSGSTAKATFTLRMAKQRASSADAAAEGVKLMRQMGAQVDVKTFGPITCSTIIPPNEKGSFNTTCSVVKNGQVGAIEIAVKKRGDMIPIEKLKPIAEKMQTRMQ